jgi:hypothetical protein
MGLGLWGSCLEFCRCWESSCSKRSGFEHKPTRCILSTLMQYVLEVWEWMGINQCRSCSFYHGGMSALRHWQFASIFLEVPWLSLGIQVGWVIWRWQRDSAFYSLIRLHFMTKPLWQLMKLSVSGAYTHFCQVNGEDCIIWSKASMQKLNMLHFNFK